MIFLQLFYEFFKAGLFAIGGGLATLPFLKQISLRYPWFTPNDLMDMIAVSESTPGPMGVNSATYAGFHAAGIPVPSQRPARLCCRRSSSSFWCRVRSISSATLRWSRTAFTACVRRPRSDLRRNARGVCRFPAAYGKLGRIASISSVINVPAIIIFLVLSLGIWKLKKLHPIVFILIGAVCGIVFNL